MKRGFPDKVKHSSAYGAVHRGAFTYGGVAPVKQSEVQRPSLAIVLNSTAPGSFQADTPDFIFLNERVAMPSLESNRHRRVRTSAAMVGLALSVGSSNVLSLWNTKEAFATEAMPTLEPLQDWSSRSTDPAAAIVPPVLQQVEDVSFSLGEPVSPYTPAFDLADYYPHELFTHQVTETETLWSIAQQYGIEPEILAGLNHLTLNSPLQVGQVLQFPRVFITTSVAKEKSVVKSGILPTDNGTEVKDGQKTGDATPSIPLEISPSGSQEDTFPVAFLPNPETTVASDLDLANLMPYRVQSGDTLDKIARTYQVSRATLVTVNQIENPNLLKVDQVIGIPRTDTGLKLAIVPEATTPDVPVLKTIQPEAQTELQNSAANAPVSPDLVSVLNPDASRFPYEPTNPLSGELSYQVRPGDTLSKIARRYGLPISDLVQANRLTNPNIIRVNQSLVIPSRAHTVVALNSDQSVQIASNSGSPTLELGSPTAPQDVRDLVAVKGSLQVNTAVIPTVPSLESIVQDPISLPRPTVVVPTPDVPRVAVAPQGVTTPFDPSAGLMMPEVADPALEPAENASGNEYVSRLLTEVRTLRQQYRAGTRDDRSSGEVVTPSPVSGSTILPDGVEIDRVEIDEVEPEVEIDEVEKASPVVPSRSSRASSVTSGSGISRLSSTDRINPEFNPQAYSESATVESPTSTASPQLLAAASVGASNYEPLVQSLVGQTVSPALPSLSADPYLPQDRSFNGYIWPAQGVLTSGYGWRWGRMHKGIDIAAPIGTPIVAAAPGVVITAGWNSGGYGYLVEVQHDDGSITLYAHNNRILVRQGQNVQQGQQLAEMGSTGYSTGPHLHFEIHPSGNGAVNPMAYLPQ